MYAFYWEGILHAKHILSEQYFSICKFVSVKHIPAIVMQ
jgi:hypothetical protein